MHNNLTTSFVPFYTFLIARCKTVPGPGSLSMQPIIYRRGYWAKVQFTWAQTFAARPSGACLACCYKRKVSLVNSTAEHKETKQYQYSLVLHCFTMANKYKTGSGEFCAVKYCSNSRKRLFLWDNSEYGEHIEMLHKDCACKVINVWVPVIVKELVQDTSQMFALVQTYFIQMNRIVHGLAHDMALSPWKCTHRVLPSQ